MANNEILLTAKGFAELEEELKRAKLIREITIKEAKNNELYRDKYYHRTDYSQKGKYDFYYHNVKVNHQYISHVINQSYQHL